MIEKSKSEVCLEVENPRLEIENSKGAMIVDFFASWCGPCKMISPLIEKIHKKYGENLKIIKVDIDKHSGLADKYQVMSVPTILFFLEGKVIRREVGFLPEAKLCEIIDSELVPAKL